MPLAPSWAGRNIAVPTELYECSSCCRLISFETVARTTHGATACTGQKHFTLGTRFTDCPPTPYNFKHLERLRSATFAYPTSAVIGSRVRSTHAGANVAHIQALLQRKPNIIQTPSRARDAWEGKNQANNILHFKGAILIPSLTPYSAGHQV
eukprot:2984382-Amphidinium_carterae.1